MPRTNINRGRDQILGDCVEVSNVGVQNFATNLSSSRTTRLWDAVAGRDFLARQWIQALKSTNQPSSYDDQTKCTLWDSFTVFCLCVERPSDGLLSDLQELDLLAVSITVALIHQEREKPSSIIARHLQAAVSWLTPMDGLLPARIIDRFQEHLERFERAFTSVPDEGAGSTLGKSRGSLSRELYALYHLMFMAHPNYEKLRPIFAAILVLPPHLKPSLTFLGLLLGLPLGEVSLALQGMHLVLDVRGQEDEICFHHSSFKEYLIDRNKSHVFHIDIPAQRHIVARQWLDGVSASKMQTYSFHLEKLSGPLQEHDLVSAVLITTEGVRDTQLAHNAREKHQRQVPLRITECHCNAQSTGNKSGDAAKHLAYQKACTRVVRAYVTEFEALARTTGHDLELRCILDNLVNSSLLQRCRLDTKLISLCNTFFGSACGCSRMWMEYSDAARMKGRLSTWIETFPESFAQEAADLTAQVNALPWDTWVS
ncbi:hypothetical protein PM082_008780 [Marasmius tenuissimus]|nr:hypothetical protein PM082_008780 [Marasmius tenuissimus]